MTIEGNKGKFYNLHLFLTPLFVIFFSFSGCCGDSSVEDKPDETNVTTDAHAPKRDEGLCQLTMHSSLFRLLALWLSV
jgi:hypothetical protein